MPEGFILIDKPTNMTSHDVVAMVRRALPKGTKVGHSGTLDPLASGLLILGIGKATKQMAKLIGLDKCYDATITLGATSPTDDAEGPITQTSNRQPTEEEINLTINKFIGEQMQTPPIFSAKKQSGQRLYKLARKGEEVKAQPHKIIIHSIALINYAYPHLELRIFSSSGTYIRSLARDIGNDLKVGGYVSKLRRTKIDSFDIKDAVKVTDPPEYWMNQIKPIDSVIR